MASQVVPHQLTPNRITPGHRAHWRARAADYSRGELAADHAVHVVGVTSALVASPVLLALTIQRHDLFLIAGVTLYLVGLVAMLASSALYNTIGLGPAASFFASSIRWRSC